MRARAYLFRSVTSKYTHGHTQDELELAILEAADGTRNLSELVEDLAMDMEMDDIKVEDFPDVRADDPESQVEDDIRMRFRRLWGLTLIQF